MRLKSLISSNHDLKKNGYQIIAKLHKLEKRKNLSKAYSATCEEGYFVVLATMNLAKLIASQYPTEVCGKKAEVFNRKSQSFVNHLSLAANKGIRINRKLLADYLRAYTHFFNLIIDEGIKFKLNQEMLIQWNVQCVMAHMSVWKV